MKTYAENKQSSNQNHHPGLTFYVIKCLFWVAFFYANAYMFSRLVHRKKYGKYVLFLILVLPTGFLLEVSYFAIIGSLSSFFIRGYILFNTFPFLFIFACSTTYQMLLDRAETAKQVREKETEHLKTELAFLRSQISPHFMFNVLNGMVALARKKSDLLEPSLIKLSSIMRYMLYENDEEKVSLEKELEYLQSYIDLQKQRFGKSISVNTSIGTIDNNYHVEPMLLIPFVENAFKHGTGVMNEGSICISLTAENAKLNFSVTNRYNAEADEIKDKTSGIGFNNVYRRLNLLYKNRHKLDIKKQDGVFTVSLQLTLS